MTENTENNIEELIARPYQQAIIDVCIKRNSIVYLPTGAGKSYIAIQVINHFSEKLEQKYTEGGKRSIFLVNTVCLAKQQAESIGNIVAFKVALLCGEMGVDYWDKAKWNEILDGNEILVSTAQVIVDAVKHSHLKLDQVNVIVFDECHHGTKDHPYHELMKMFRELTTITSIRIIGLSGMLIGNDSKVTPYTVQDDLRKLEATFQSTVVTVNNQDDYENVLVCSTNATESLVVFENHPSNQCVVTVAGILDSLKQAITNTKPIFRESDNSINPKNLRPTAPKKIKDLIALLKDFMHQVAEMGPYGGYLSLLSTLIQLELTKRTCDSENFRTVVKTCITTTEHCINLLVKGLGLHNKDPEVILSNSSNKVNQLFKLLVKMFKDPEHKDDQCLIFVEQRSTAKALYHALKEYAAVNKEFPIIPDFMVGVNAGLPESIESVISANYQSVTLDKFMKKETNCIVTTNVLEEGIDLQMCNLVVTFDAPKTYRSYVQAKGRARVDKSNYIVMIQNNQETKKKFIKKVLNWRAVDKELKSQLLLKTIDRAPPTEEDIRREQEEVWEPFITPISRSTLNNVNSVSLLHRYACSMPSDRFTNLKVTWDRIDHEDKSVSAVLQLPSQSALKNPVTGDAKGGVRLAKQHAAFKACKMLYDLGELNDHLVPVDNSQKVELVEQDYFQHWKGFENDKKSAGTRNNRRYHQIKDPNLFENAAPNVGGFSFLYRINVRPKFDTMENKALKQSFKLLGNGKDFGILTSRRFPKLCAMTLFQSYGEIEVEINDLPVAVNIKTEQELKTLQDFHVAIFRDVLKTWKNYFILDKTSYLIVPLTEAVRIDWKIAGEFSKVEQPRRLTYDEIKTTQFDHENYFERVITPMHRHTDQKYIVLQVDETKTPLSPFPNDKYESFQEHVQVEYDTSVCNLTQPMLEVKGISNNLNLFFPGAGSTGKQRRHEKENSTEFYIPELVHNFKLHAGFWLKALLLPCVCHRLHYLLLAEELRAWLIKENIDEGNGTQLYKLDVDYGDYDQREKSLEEQHREHESAGRLKNFLTHMQIPQSSKAVSKSSRTLLMWNREELPKDIDKNWLDITEADIISYVNFFEKNQNQVLPANLRRIIEEHAPRLTNFLMDTEDRHEIKLLQQKAKFNSVQQKDLIKVLTTSNAGDVFDMERFEVLGDGFLKFISTLFLYNEYPDWHEGLFTTLKGKIVSNKNLFYIGKIFGLSTMIKASKFDATLPPSTSLPLNLLQTIVEDKKLLSKLSGVAELSDYELMSGYVNAATLEKFTQKYGFEIEPDENDPFDGVDRSMLLYIKQHYVGDKVVADAVEAFLGVVVQSCGVEACLKLCQKLKILPNKDLSTLLTADIPPRVFELNNSSCREARIQNQKQLEKTIGYTFNDPRYLVQALTHRTYPVKTMGTYEQLEFLGDAVLDFLVTSYSSEQCPKLDPGKLTDLRSALVNNVTLACIVVRNGLHKYLLAENSVLSESIQRFVCMQTQSNHRIVIDQILLCETEDETGEAEAVEVPKVIGDIFESIVGAVYLDSGKNLRTTWDVIYGLMKQEINDFIANVPMQIIRRLYEYQKGVLEPKFYDYEVINETTVAVPLAIKVNNTTQIFLGMGKNRTLAKKCAAKLALRALEGR